MDREAQKSLVINILWCAFFALITLNGVLNHEIWADEAQVWLLCKNLSVFDLWKHLVNEGHPSFFYLLVMPFAKLNFSIIAMQIICWLGTVLGAFMVLQFSPFSRFVKFSILASAGFLYFFPIIARSYSILPFLVCLAAYLYTKNQERPLWYAVVLALIANTHVIMFAFSAVLGGIFLYDNVIKRWNVLSYKDKKINIGAVSIVALGLLAVVIQLCGTMNSNVAIGFSIESLLDNTKAVMLQFFVNILDYTMVKSKALSFIPLLGGALLAVLTLISFVALALTNLRMFFVAFFGITFQWFIYISSYRAYIYPSRIACAYLILIFCFWVVLSSPYFQEKFKVITKKSLNIILGLMFILTTMNGLRFYLMDLLNNYSSTKDTAVYIEKNIPKDAFIITANDPFSLGIYYYLPENRIWSYMQQKYIKYVEWNDGLAITFQEKNWSDIIRKNLNQQGEHKGIYIIQSSYNNFNPLDTFSEKDFKVVYKSPPALADGEAFKIYKFVGK